MKLFDKITGKSKTKQDAKNSPKGTSQ